MYVCFRLRFIISVYSRASYVRGSGFLLPLVSGFFIYKQLDALVPFSSPDCGIFCLYIFVVRF